MGGATIHRYIAELKERGVQLWVDKEGRLKFRAREGAMTAELRAELKAKKPAIVETLLAAYQARNAGRTELQPAPLGRGPALSPAQERLWFMEQLEPGGAVFLLPEARRFGGSLDAAALEEGARAVIRRHESLRAGFRDENGKPALRIRQNPAWSLSMIDLSGLSPDRGEAVCRREIARQASAPFDLTKAPLFRGCLLRLHARDHALVFTTHHIISDGWSQAILEREWRARYRAAAAGLEPETPPPLPRYSDFAYWQNSAHERAATQLDYWRRQLAGAPILHLPTDRPRPAKQTYRGGIAPFRFSAKTLHGLKQLANQRNSTLFMTLLAAFSTLMHRYSGQTDLMIGTSTGSRPHPSLEDIIGLFVNLLALRIDASDDPSFEVMVDRARETTLAAYENQDVPFERVVDACGAPRDISRHPLFQVQLAFTGAPPEHAPWPGLNEARYDWGGVSASRQDLTIGFTEHEGHLIGGVEYNADLFERDTVENLISRLISLIDHGIAHPDARLSQLPILTAAERTLLDRWNRTDQSYPRELCLHQAFEARAARAPDAIALAGDHGQISYAELNRRANRLARRLRASGLGPDRLAGICLEPGPGLAIAILAALKTGGAYAPLDPSYPQERLAFMLEDTELAMLITEEATVNALPAFELNFLELFDIDDPSLDEESADNLDATAWPDNLANVIYTSGSTGAPKGASITHRNIARLIFDRKYAPIDESDRLIQLSNISFDALNFELWTAILHGGRLCFTAKSDLLDHERFAGILERSRITAVFITTPLFHQFMRDRPRLFDCLRILLVGGDQMSPAAVRSFLATDGQRPRFCNIYGPTESATFALYRQVDRIEPGAAILPIGRPIANTRVYLLDRFLEPTPLGIPGEIYIGGDGLARGYLKRPELTAQQFIPDPFATVSGGGRLYRTGDVGKRRRDGDIEFIGRRDNQVKIRGFRIEPGEIESTLAKHPKVGQAVATPIKDDRGERLAAYVTPKLETPLPAELRAFLKETLPDYMIPSAFVILSGFPLSPNGKIDRKALPTANPEEKVVQKGYDPPVTETEKTMAKIWSEVLGVKRIGLRDNFFELGGDSLLSIQIKALANKAGLHFELHALFEKPTIADLLDVAKIGDAAAAPASIPPFALTPARDRAAIDEELIEDAYPLSHLQLGLLFHSAFEDRPGSYHVALLFRIAMHFDELAFRDALAQAARRHDILRASLDLAGFSRPLTLIWRKSRIPLEVADIRGVREPAKFLRRWLNDDKKKTFDWTKPPLFRATVFLSESGAFFCAISFHHAILDGWSDAALFSEIIRRYAARLANRAMPCEPPKTRYRDFVALEQRVLESAAARDFWDRLLDDCAPCQTPRWGQAAAPADGEAQKIEPIPISAFVSRRLHELCQTANAPLKTVLLAGHLKTMSMLYGRRDIVTGLGVNGRPETEGGDETLGLFVNTLPFRCRLADGSWLDLINQAFALEKRVMPHRRYPLSEIVKRRQGETPFDSAFNFTHFHVLESLQKADVQEQVEECGGLAETNFTLLFNLSLDPGDDQIHAYMVYDASAVTAEQARLIATHYGAALGAMALTPAEPHHLKRLITDGEAELLRRWNRTGTSGRELQPAHRLFETFAHWASQADALMFGERRISYGELNQRANRLSLQLARHGAGIETPVGVLLPREPAAIEAVLAIWKASAIYTPLDPAHPTERIHGMAMDAGLRLIVGNREHAGLLPDFDGVWLDPDELAKGPEPAPRQDQEPTPPLSIGAYIIFTSGSTGRPKGALIDHRGLANHLAAMRFTFELGPGRRVAQFSSLTFDASVSEITMALGSGATLCMGDRQEMAPGPDLAMFLRDRRVNTLTIPPSALAALPAAQLPHLDALIVAGEACPEDLAVKWSMDRELHNNYGPTEAAIWTTHSLYSGGKPMIGTPIRNTRIYVVDPFFQLAPIGSSGELCIAGFGLARGYLGRPDLTALRFTPNPFEERVGARLYRSGDMARWTPEGELDFLGRTDSQVKIRGFRIELGEIRAALESHPRVARAEAAARPRAAAGSGMRLAAYVVFHDNSVAADALRAYLAHKLPSYMIPDGFATLEELPRTTSGKIDRRALPPLTDEAIGSGRAYAPPRTPTEGTLARIWADVLELERVGAAHHFFELGGHSLLATQVVSRIRDQFDVSLPVKSLFQNPVLSQLARRIDDALLAAGQEAVEPPIEPRPQDEPTPLSFAQERMWFLDRLEPENIAYNMPLAFELHGQMQPLALLAALGETVRRHEALRARFPSADGSPLQIIEPAEAFAPAVVDLSSLPADEAAATAEGLANREAARPFNLSEGPLFRACLFLVAAGDARLALNAHHIVSDGWSTKIVLNELAALYRAYWAGQPSPLPEPELQYGDFAFWQRRRLPAKILEQQLAFWERALAGAPAHLNLPVDHPRPAEQTFRGGAYDFALPAELGESLDCLCRQEGVTPFMALLAAYAAVLARHAGQDEICAGAPIANRNRSQIEGVVGFFANTLTLRVDLSGMPSFRELLARVKRMALDAYAHQDVPFEQVVDRLKLERDLSRSPLFQTLFSMETTGLAGDAASLKLPRLDIKPMAQDFHVSKFELSLYMARIDGKLYGSLEYNADLFAKRTAARLAGHLRRLLEEALWRPAEPVTRLAMMDDAERRRTLVEWNLTAAPLPGVNGLSGLFEAQAAAAPAATAVVDGGESWTYDKLNQRANQIAHYLREQGAGPETPVAICLRRTPEMAAALMATLKTGAPYVPLDPDHPGERIVATLEDSRARWILTHGSLADHLPQEPARALFLDQIATTLGRMSRANLGAPIHLEATAYVLFTSGSTGRPKGVAVAHRAALALAGWALRIYEPQDFAAVMAGSFIGFDLSVFELFVTLAAGGAVHLAADPISMPRAPITLINTVPSAARELVRSGAVPETTRTVNLAGEPLSADLPKALYKLPHIRKVYNLYGPSEDATYSTFALMPRDDPREPCIGAPIDNACVYLTDPWLQPVAHGCSGEITLAGAGLARAYVGRPDLTAAAFIPNPFGDVAGSRLYKTGDIGRRRNDGSLEFLGRRDFQVKIRGFRIELGEIENVLRAHPDLRDAAVIPIQSPSAQAGEQLAAYVVPAEHQRPDAENLRFYLRRFLPGYMIPAFFAHLNALPLTATGKLDRQALPTPASIVDERSYTPPRTVLERDLAAIWREALGLDMVGVHDNFFELGGHSLLAARVAARASRRFQVDLSVRTMFAAATVASLAKTLESLRRANASALPALEPAGRGAAPVLSYAQERLWFLDQLEGPSSVYNMPMTLRLNGSLQVSALARALTEIARRHRVLTASFRERNGKPVVSMDPRATPRLTVADLDSAPEPIREDLEAILTRKAALAPFDLANPPLIRTLLLKSGRRRWTLCVNIHHIVSDGWSLGIFIKELAALYEAFAHGKPSPLEPPARQYFDFARWQRDWLAGDLLREHIEGWRQTLTPPPAPLELPTDYPRPPEQTYRGASLSATLDAPLSESLAALARQERASLFMAIAAAFATILSRLSGQRDIVIGTPIAGRNHYLLENMIGFFINTLAIRVNLAGEPTFRTLLARVREVALDAYERQDLPFAKLVEALQPKRDQSRNPIFQVFLNMLNMPAPEPRLGGLELSSVDPPEIGSKFDLTLYVDEQPQGVRFDLHYNADLFGRERMRAFMDQFQALLERATNRPDLPIERYSLLTVHQRTRLPDPARPLIDDAPRHTAAALISARAQRQPHCLALIGERETWRYGQLEETANRLAHFLQAHGAGAGAIVAVYGSRDPALVAALLAVHKAGAAFVSLDAAHPAPRLIDIVKQTEPKAWLTLEAAGPISPELTREIEQINPPCQISLPRTVREINEKLASYPTLPPAAGPRLEDPAYVAFTSGTTGAPRGILGTHEPLSHFIQWQARAFELNDRDRFAMLSGLSHDPLLRDLFTPLALGAVLCAPHSATMADPRALCEWMRDRKITAAHLTPPLLRYLASGFDPDSAALSALRWVWFSGDQLTCGDVACLERLAPGATAVNFYGATETPQAVSFWRAPAPENGESISARLPRVMPLGRGIPGFDLALLNRARRLAAVGELAEIHVRSRYLACGYWRDDALTAERFAPNPFTNDAGDRFYRTGDLARYLPNGDVAFVGRRDRQVNVRGYRVELAEIERLLRARDDIAEAAAKTEPAADGVRILAYAAPARGDTARWKKIGGPTLRQWLREKLPDYMVPAAVVVLDALPLTPQGKLDRDALPAPDEAPLEREYVPPRTPTEEIVAGIWAEVLTQERVSALANFFELGGHSLLGAQVMARIRHSFAVFLPLQRLFAAPTVASLSRAVEAARRAGSGGEPPIAPFRPSGEPPDPRPELPEHARPDIPLSFEQVRPWELEGAIGPNAIYNLAYAIRLRGLLDLRALEYAFSEIMRRHDSLRSLFHAWKGEPLVVCPPHRPSPTPVIDLSGLAKPEGAVQALAAREAVTPFALARGPLIRLHALRVSRQETVFMFTLHHIVTDGWSTGVLIREWRAFYHAQVKGVDYRPPELAIQYSDYAVWQRRLLTGKRLAQLRRFWSDMLDGAPPLLDLPTDRPRPKERTFNGLVYGFLIEPDIGQAARLLSQRNETTLFMTLLAVFAILLKRYSGQDDLLIGSLAANRNRKELEPLIGLFVTCLLMRFDVGGSPSFRDFLAAVRQTVLGAYTHQDLPFRLATEAAGLRPHPSYGWFQSIFALQNLPTAELELQGLQLEPLERVQDSAKVDLTLTVTETEAGLYGAIEYNTDLFDEDRIVQLAEHFETLLRAAASEPERPIDELPATPPAPGHRAGRNANR